MIVCIPYVSINLKHNYKYKVSCLKNEIFYARIPHYTIEVLHHTKLGGGYCQKVCNLTKTMSE